MIPDTTLDFTRTSNGTAGAMLRRTKERNASGRVLLQELRDLIVVIEEQKIRGSDETSKCHSLYVLDFDCWLWVEQIEGLKVSEIFKIILGGGKISRISGGTLVYSTKYEGKLEVHVQVSQCEGSTNEALRVSSLAMGLWPCRRETCSGC
jgi:hypothetical protein